MNSDEIVLPILRAINDLRDEVKENKREIRDMREENNKRWDENDKRWNENNKRWDENDKRLDINEKNREKDHEEVLDIFAKYDIVISRKIGDPNVEKMRKILKM